MDDKKSSFVVPIAIIVCILIVAGAFYYQSKNPSKPSPVSAFAPSHVLDSVLTLNDGQGGTFDVNQFDLSKLRPVDATDHILGSADAPVKIIVYTDLECPACKYFHSQLKPLESKYVASGKLAIVYREFPLIQIHPKSPNEFLAAECVNEIGGNDKFWQFVDQIFAITPSNNGLDPAKLGETAKTLGVNTKSFDACMTAQKYAAKVQKSLDEAVALGLPGTPTFFFVDPTGAISPRGFTYPTASLSSAIDLLLTIPPSAPVAPVSATTSDLTASTTGN